eukprot:UN29205
MKNGQIQEHMNGKFELRNVSNFEVWESGKYEDQSGEGRFDPKKNPALINRLKDLFDKSQNNLIVHKNTSRPKGKQKQ